MEQKIDVFTPKEAVHIEKQRNWVRDHYSENTRDRYSTVEGKLRLLDVILSSGWIETSETWKLQSLGIAFGDSLVQELGLKWVIVEDEYGRDPALQFPDTSILIFPLTTISKRIERGERVDVVELFAQACSTINEKRASGY